MKLDVQEIRSLTRLVLRPWYATGRSNLAVEYFAPCLRACVRYDRAVGFFSSSVYLVAPLALADFVEQGGKIRLICSPHLSERDVLAIESGFDATTRVSQSIVSDIRDMAANPDTADATKVLASLVQESILDIRIAFRVGRYGLFHSKVGLFESEDGARVAFNGSANESANAIAENGNYEDVTVFTSWGSESDSERVGIIASYFESLWHSDEPGVDVIPFPQVPKDELLKYQHPGGARVALMDYRARMQSLEPTERGTLPLLPHQIQAANDWEHKRNRGLLTHATGAGKTLTAIEIIRRWLSQDQPAIFVVPNIILLEQIRKIAEIELAHLAPKILTVGGARPSPNWLDSLIDFTRDDKYFGPRLTIATMQTAASERFLKNVLDGEHLLIVVDEVHHIGSPFYRNVLDLQAGGRLGLSATPIRYGDQEGTSLIQDYFGPELQPIIGLNEAIKIKRLVPYDYFVHKVWLTDVEAQKWRSMSTSIARLIGARDRDSNSSYSREQQLKLLLFQRSAIAKRAQNKPNVAAQVLKKEFSPGDRWLVYCDTVEQLNQCREELSKVGIDSIEYHSTMQSDRTESLRFFETQGGVLVSIRCLDEGVDIPLVDHALILASSSNPREFVQRRGRVLRTAPNKYFAEIHDVIVVPPESNGDLIPILETELARATEFSATARNASINFELRRIANELGLTTRLASLEDFEEEEQMT